jgi:hypothetical protein
LFTTDQPKEKTAKLNKVFNPARADKLTEFVQSVPCVLDLELGLEVYNELMTLLANMYIVKKEIRRSKLKDGPVATCLEIENLRCKMLKSLRVYKSTNSNTARLQFISDRLNWIRKNAEVTRVEAKKTAAKFHSILANRDNAKMWRMLREDDAVVGSCSDCIGLNVWKSHFSNIMFSSHPPLTIPDNPNSDDPDLDGEISLSELTAAIMKRNKRKGAGSDGVDNEAIHFLFSNINGGDELLVRLFNVFFKAAVQCSGANILEIRQHQDFIQRKRI